VIHDTTPVGSFLVLTEDSAEDAEPVVVALVKSVLKYVDSRTGTHRLRFEPGNELARKAMRANLWKSTNPKDRAAKVNLRQSIATKLLEGVLPGFVIFHFDGDRSWAQRATSENVSKFETEIALPVLQILQASGRSADEVAIAMEKLVRFTPFYSVEAWLLLNIAVARQCCAGHSPRAAQCQFETWEADRGVLDELMQTKEHVCFGASRNRVLAESAFPVIAAISPGKSLAMVADRLAHTSALVAVLASTYA
jgi:hypothetical protein